jgi:hypothetical protein
VTILEEEEAGSIEAERAERVKTMSFHGGLNHVA